MAVVVNLSDSVVAVRPCGEAVTELFANLCGHSEGITRLCTRAGTHNGFHRNLQLHAGKQRSPLMQRAGAHNGFCSNPPRHARKYRCPLIHQSRNPQWFPQEPATSCKKTRIFVYAPSRNPQWVPQEPTTSCKKTMISAHAQGPEPTMGSVGTYRFERLFYKTADFGHPPRALIIILNKARGGQGLLPRARACAPRELYLVL